MSPPWRDATRDAPRPAERAWIDSLSPPPRCLCASLAFARIIAIPAVVAGDTWKWRNRTVAPVVHYFFKLGESLFLWLVLLCTTYIFRHRDHGMWPTTTPPCPVDGPRFSDPDCLGCCRGPVMRTEAVTLFCLAHAFMLGGYLFWWPSQRR